MPNNPDKRPCAHPGCRAWARRDAVEPYCASHLHLATGLPPEHPDTALPAPGAPLGNQNRLVHGFYRRTLHVEDADDLDQGAQAGDLDAEILIARLALRRTLAMLHTGTTLGDHSQPLTNDALNALFAGAWPGPGQERDFGPILQRSLGYVCAYLAGQLVGFVNVAWDGGVHTFLLDTTVRSDLRRQGIGRQLVRHAEALSRGAGAEWLHVDFEPELEAFYRKCGFFETRAGLIDLQAPAAVDSDP